MEPRSSPTGGGESPDDSVARLLAAAARTLYGESARAEVELLLAQALDCPRSWLYAHADDLVAGPQREAFAQMLERRRRGEPVAHILGRREFWSLELSVTADTLIPRPETELLVELALARIAPGGDCRVLDLGTGSGAIALAIASERPSAQVTAVDAGARTLEVARKNAARLGLARVRFLLSDWFSAVADERFEVIASNPPYIASDDSHLRAGDLRFEPTAALASGPDGLDALRLIASQAPRHLVPGGWLLLEHGAGQGEAVRNLLSAARFAGIDTRLDLEARERVTLGRLPDCPDCAQRTRLIQRNGISKATPGFPAMSNLIRLPFGSSHTLSETRLHISR